MEREIEKHLEEDQFEAYAMHVMSGDELDCVEEHLLFCEACQDRMQAVESYVKAMRGAALRIRTKKKTAPAAGGAFHRLGSLLHAPLPVWGGAIMMAVLLVMVSLHQVRQHPGAPVDVELQAVRGESAGTALAGHALNLHLDNQGVRYLPNWSIEIVDSEGSRVWNGTGAWSDTAIRATVSKSFSPGTYYVRILQGAVDPVREYQLVVK